MRLSSSYQECGLLTRKLQSGCALASSDASPILKPRSHRSYSDLGGVPTTATDITTTATDDATAVSDDLNHHRHSRRLQHRRSHEHQDPSSDHHHSIHHHQKPFLYPYLSSPVTTYWNDKHADHVAAISPLVKTYATITYESYRSMRVFDPVLPAPFPTGSNEQSFDLGALSLPTSPVKVHTHALHQQHQEVHEAKENDVGYDEQYSPWHDVTTVDQGEQRHQQQLQGGAVVVDDERTPFFGYDESLLLTPPSHTDTSSETLVHTDTDINYGDNNNTHLYTSKNRHNYDLNEWEDDNHHVANGHNSEEHPMPYFSYDEDEEELIRAMIQEEEDEIYLNDCLRLLLCDSPSLPDKERKTLLPGLGSDHAHSTHIDTTSKDAASGKSSSITRRPVSLTRDRERDRIPIENRVSSTTTGQNYDTLSCSSQSPLRLVVGENSPH